jgi:hypothetical protein
MADGQEQDMVDPHSAGLQVHADTGSSACEALEIAGSG